MIAALTKSCAWARTVEEAVTAATPTYRRRTSRRLRRHRGVAGFTLVELMFVVMIIAVASAVAIPSINAGRRQREVRRTMQNFVSTVRQASSTAIFERRRVELRVWPDDGEYGIVVPPSAHHWDEAELDVDERDELEEQDEVVHRFLLPETAAFGQIDGGRSNDLEELGTISFDFYPTGSSSGGAIEFIFGEDRGRQVYVLTINPLVSSLDVEEGS